MLFLLMAFCVAVAIFLISLTVHNEYEDLIQTDHHVVSDILRATKPRAK
jgi:hypothetical protein